MLLVEVVLDHPAANTLFIFGCLYTIENFLHSSTQKNALTLRETVWLHDISLPFLFCVSFIWFTKLISEVNVVNGKDPSCWKEVELLSKGSFHSHEIACEVVLSRDLVHARIVIYLLPRVKFGQKVGRDAQIVPRYVPLFDKFLVVLTSSNSAIMVLMVLPDLEVVHFACHFSDNVIFSAV